LKGFNLLRITKNQDTNKIIILFLNDMTENRSTAVFENKLVRRYYDEKAETWYFSVVDIIEALTDSSNPTDYLKKLRKRDTELGSYIGTNCPQVEMETNSGKKRKTLGGNVKDIFRIIQSVPSPKAEPFKQWLAKTGYERVQEISDPEQSLDRARENWQRHGRSEKWIQQRMTGQETRNKLTDYWKQSGVEKSDEFALLTNIIHQEWTGLTVKKHKDLKGLKTQNLRDHMNEAELIFTALAELSTRQIAETDEAKGLNENAKAGKKGGAIAKNARLALEAKTGKRVVTGENFLPPSKEKKKLK
jgi:DNA-damage-inducible protein D